MSFGYWILTFILTVLSVAVLIWRAGRRYEDGDARWADKTEFNRNYRTLSDELINAVEECGLDSAEAQKLIRQLIAAQMKYAETHGVESEKTIGALISLLPPKPR